MTKHRKKGVKLLVINFTILLIAYTLLQFDIWGLLPGLVMMAEVFMIIMVAVRYFVYEADENMQTVMDDFAKDISTGTVKGLEPHSKK